MGWYLHPLGYAASHGPTVNGRRASVLLHRLIMNASPGSEIDHINHIKLDCCKVNLRAATKSQNMQNRKGPQVNCRTGVRGVISYNTRSQGTKFRASIQLNGKHINRWAIASLQEAEAIVHELRRMHFTHSQECVS